MKFVKNSLTRLIMEKIAEVGEAYLDIFFPPHYSYTRISRRLFGLDSYPEVSRQTLSAILSRLRHQGLVTRMGSHKKSSWSLTKPGKRWLQKNYEQGITHTIPKRDDIARLVIFDIPERERKKRDLLRTELIVCNFRKLQRSVWIGYNPLPEYFIALLDELRLKSKVHIFSIQQKGTIEI